MEESTMVKDLQKLVRYTRNEANYMRFSTGGNTTGDALEDLANEIEKILNRYNYTVTQRPGDSRGLGFRVSPYGLFAGMHAR